MGIEYSGKQIEAVVFDFDGTLYKISFWTKLLFLLHNLNNISLFFAHRKVMKKLRETDFGSSGKYFSRFFNDISALTGKTTGDIKFWYENCFQRSFVYILEKHCKPSKETVAFLGFLKENNIKTAIFSDYGFISERLRALNLDKNNFDILVSGEEEGVLKPGTRPLKKIAEIFNLMPENIILVGDRPDTDGFVAKNAQMHFIQINELHNFTSKFSNNIKELINEEV